MGLADTSVRGYAGYVPSRRSGIGLPSSSNTRRCSGVGAESFSRRRPLHDLYEIASCSAAPADRHDHQIMAGYPVQRGHPPAITWEAAHRRLRDSGTLSGTSAEQEQMTGKIMPCAHGTPARSRPRPTPSCPRRGTPTRTPAAATPACWTGCSPGSAAAARWPRSAGRNWPACWSNSGGSGPRRPGTATAARWPPGCPGAPPAGCPPRSCRPAPNGAASTSTPPARYPALRSTGR